jgi:hypothetical protein
LGYWNTSMGFIWLWKGTLIFNNKSNQKTDENSRNQCLPVQ